MKTQHGRSAIVREKGGRFEIEDVTLTLSKPDDVLIRITATGICHTDAIVRDQYYPFPLPGVLGHEGSGIIEEVGESVTELAPGDHVILTYMSCSTCRMCRQGEPAYCENFFALNVGGARCDGSTGTCDSKNHEVHDHFFGQSSFGTFALADRRNVIKVDKELPLELLGPLGCGIQTGAGAVLNSLKVGYGATIAIFGVGSVGLSAVMAARVAGATQIIAVDPQASRRDMAMELGATEVVDPSELDSVEQILALTQRGVDFSLDTSGRPEVVRQAIDALAIRGTCGIVGAPPLGTEASFDVNSLLIPGRTIRGICEGDSVSAVFIPQLLELYKQGRFPFDRLVTFYEFDQINEAVDDTLSGASIKAILKMVSNG
ncbi:MAG: NAD(P)-dependent alcohol dehydrogenase [Parasphingorhabdus sp.]|uniref:NAD(P)-dependent alcohol dehydrogenase n=1 Tax=Parasphingorhabdus sp. TaxID=2709688 RepID=UPI0030021F7E